MGLSWSDIFSFLACSLVGGYFVAFTPQGIIIWEKITMYFIGFHNLLLSKDSKWKEQLDTDLIKDKYTKSKRIIFIRHGESTWNEVFNKGFGPSFFYRLSKELVKEIMLFPSRDSVFFDSPLNAEGIQQAKEVHEFIERGIVKDEQAKKDMLSITGHNGSSVLVSSNLRRAVQTATIGLWGRTGRHGHKIKVLSCLQEVSRNVDCVALTQKQKIPIINVHEFLNAPEHSVSSRLDIAENHGHKPISQNGLYRMNQFCNWAMNRPEDYIIATGHSLYFKKFFANFLPKNSNHLAKSCKMQNCAIVAFTLYEGEHNGQKMFRIDPKSILPLHKGFAV